jgi:hypothetical protein
MATKTIKNSDEKFERQDFDLFKALSALDKKNYTYFENLSEEQQRKFVPYMMTYWMSSVKSNNMLQSYYLISSDMNANKHLFNEQVQKHPHLQWLMLCTISPGLGEQFHQYIPHMSPKISELRTKANKSDFFEYFQKIYKNTDTQELSHISEELVRSQNHKYRLSKIYNEMKLSDIESLASLVTPEELDEYDRQSGN